MAKGRRSEKWIRERAESGLCLCCDNEAFSRGLCQSCHRYCMGQIRSGTVEEKDLIGAGLLLPSKRKGRRIKAAIAKEIAKLKH